MVTKAAILATNFTQAVVCTHLKTSVSFYHTLHGACVKVFSTDTVSSIALSYKLSCLVDYLPPSLVVAPSLV